MTPATDSRSDDSPRVRRLIVLGSTGSIGTQALEVASHLNALHARGEFPWRHEIVGLAAGKRAGDVLEQARRFGVADIAIAENDGSEIDASLNVRRGPDAAERLVREVECDVVLAAIVGVAGLGATLAAVELGRDVALANKETLVAAGEVVIPAARRSGSRLLPVDSEHAALWQCLSGGAGRASPLCPPMELPPEVSRVILTASGGPFRTSPLAEMEAAGPDLALKHPTWSMGAKVTIDCASLMNKGLEVIEAHWLFGVPGERIGVVVHPQSVVHAMAELADGSVVAQMASPDMRLAIQQALAHPHRVPSPCRPLDWRSLGRLDFEPPDAVRFPALSLAYRAIESGGTAGATLNAANEVAVEQFLARRIPFGRIPRLVAAAMDALPPRPVASLADVMRADAEARAFVRSHLDAHARATASA